MFTTAIINPDVVGNIGSCKTHVISLTMSRPSIFYEIIENISTNSCTGEVVKYISWGLTGFSVAVIILVFILVFMFIGAMLLSVLTN